MYKQQEQNLHVARYITLLCVSVKRHIQQGLKIKILKYQRPNPNEKFMRKQTQKMCIYQGPKVYLTLYKKSYKFVKVT